MVSRGKFDKRGSKKARKKEADEALGRDSSTPDVSAPDESSADASTEAEDVGSGRARAASTPGRRRFGATGSASKPRVDASLLADPSADAKAQDPESVAADAAVEAAAESMIALAAGELRSALEAVLFSLAEPVTIRTLADLFGVTVHDVRAAVEELRQHYIDAERAFRLEDIAGGVQILTLSRYDAWIRRFRHNEREGRLSAAALETLAVIAYKQPLNKATLESIRGVGCGPILKTLLDRGLIQICGREDTLGKPLLYGTTRRFLETFGLHSVRDLPQPDLEARREAERALEAAPGEDAGSAGSAGSAESAESAGDAEDTDGLTEESRVEDLEAVEDLDEDLEDDEDDEDA